MLQASQLALKLQMMDMDDIGLANSASSSQKQQSNTSSREMLLEFDARHLQAISASGDTRVTEAAAVSSSISHDIPVDTPRFEAVLDKALPHINSAALNGVSDGNSNSDALTESDLGSFPSGSNSARLSNSGRCL